MSSACRKRRNDLEKLQEIVKLLAEGTPLPANHRDHPLIGPWHFCMGRKIKVRKEK
ncbi:MAG: hypothetical protein COS57_01520 [Syntrophobacterales bacterium CG03_land_8_20_14_0_80_58_14]|nr:MAG: hypothetical protein COS57_01520 [Syntrophobacterales bacterium CG03_land_8_20_14_0_80_58_14]